MYKLLQRGEDDAGEPSDMARIARSSYLGKNPFGDGATADNTTGLEPEQPAGPMPHLRKGALREDSQQRAAVKRD